MRPGHLNNLIILSDHHFIDRLVNNLGLIGHHGPTVHTRVYLIEIIYLILTGFRSYWIDVGCRETLIYRPGRLKPDIGLKPSKALPGLGAFNCTLMKYTPCLPTKRIL